MSGRCLDSMAWTRWRLDACRACMPAGQAHVLPFFPQVRHALHDMRRKSERRLGLQDSSSAYRSRSMQSRPRFDATLVCQLCEIRLWSGSDKDGQPPLVAIACMPCCTTCPAATSAFCTHSSASAFSRASHPSRFGRGMCPEQSNFCKH